MAKETDQFARYDREWREQRTYRDGVVRYFYLERDAALETVEDANGERRTGHRRFEQRAIDAWSAARPACWLSAGKGVL